MKFFATVFLAMACVSLTHHSALATPVNADSEALSAPEKQKATADSELEVSFFIRY